MIFTIKEKWILASIIHLAIFLTPLCASKPTRISIYGYGSYTTHAFFKLESPLSHSDLLVEIIAEYNDPNGPCHVKGQWLMLMHAMDLRFTLDDSSAQDRLAIWPRRHNKRKYGIGGLDEIRSSTWYSALKRLAMDVGVQHYGKKHLQRNLTEELSKLGLRQSHRCPKIVST